VEERWAEWTDEWMTVIPILSVSPGEALPSASAESLSANLFADFDRKWEL